jgi:hypothetical protein
MAAPQALTPEQIQQIIAAGRGNTVNLNGTIYQGNYADTGSGETFQEGALQDIYGYTPEQNKVGGTYNQYDPTGAFSRTGTQQEVNAGKDFMKFLAGAGLTFALPGALSGSLFGGAGAAANAGTTFAGEALADAGLLAGGGAAAGAAASGLTATQIANLAKAGINVAGLLGATNAISNMGGGNTSTTATPVTYSGGGAGGYSPEYFSQLQSNYNSLMPNVPRDVASPLQNWYSTEFNPGASITGSLFGGMAPTSLKPVTPPVVKPPVVPPTYANLTKTSSPTDVAKAYADFIANAGGNTAANRQAATDYLTNLGLTQSQIESSYSAYLNTLPAAGNTYQQLNAKATPSNVVQAYTAFIANAGGDTATNRQLAADYLKDIGVSDTLINQAYNTYLSSTTNAGGGGGGVDSGGGMMSGGGASTTGTATAAPSYTTLGASSSPQSIAAAYADFVANSGGDTAANQQAAVEYLTNLGIGQDTIGSAYGLFKGA